MKSRRVKSVAMKSKLKYKKKVPVDTTNDVEQVVEVKTSDVVDYDTMYDGRTPQNRPVGDSWPNQWMGTQQQERFLQAYLDPQSHTFANVYASAQEAGYSETYAKVMSSPSFNLQWIKEARNIVSMKPEHVIQRLQREALNDENRTTDKLKALELIGKAQGMFVDRKLIGHVNLEQALNDLE